MSIPLVVVGSTFNYPTEGDRLWAQDATGWANAVTNGMLQKTGGNFTLLSDVDFGPTAGLKAAYHSTRTTPAATAGVFRLANTESINWRNNANTADASWFLNAIDTMTYSTPTVANAVNITSAGNLGIGTTAPNVKLHATTFSATNVALRLENSVSSAYFVQRSDGDVEISASSVGTGIVFKTNGSSNDKVKIDANGNVSLTATADSSVGYSATNSSASANAAAQVLLGTSDTTMRMTAYPSTHGTRANQVWVNVQESGKVLVFGTGNTERGRIDTNGNLLVGSTSTNYRAEFSKTSGAAQVGIIAANNSYSELYFGDTDSKTVGALSYDHTTNALATFVNGAERMRVDANGNVGIGVVPSAWSPAQKLVQLPGGALSSSTAAEVFLGQNVYYGGSPVSDRFVTTRAASSFGQVLNTFTWRQSTNASPTADSVINWNTAMTLDNGGNLQIGQTASGYSNSNSHSLAVNGVAFVNHVNGTANGTAYTAYGYNGGGIGSVTQNGTTGVTYNTSSDYRLKHNQQALIGSGAFIDALKPKTWTWAQDGSAGAGFIAHEFQAVSPSSVTGTKDAVDADGKPVYQSMQASSAEVMANIIAELQELRKRLAKLEK